MRRFKVSERGSLDMNSNKNLLSFIKPLSFLISFLVAISGLLNVQLPVLMYFFLPSSICINQKDIASALKACGISFIFYYWLTMVIQRNNDDKTCTVQQGIGRKIWLIERKKAYELCRRVNYNNSYLVFSAIFEYPVSLT